MTPFRSTPTRLGQSLPRPVIGLIIVVVLLAGGTLYALIRNLLAVNSAIPATERSAGELPRIAALRNSVLRLDALAATQLGIAFPNFALLAEPRAAVAEQLNALKESASPRETLAGQEQYAQVFTGVDELLLIYDLQAANLERKKDSATIGVAKLELRRAFDNSETLLDELYKNKEAEFITTTASAFATFRTVQTILIGASVMILGLGGVLAFTLRQSVQSELRRAYNRQQVAAEVGRAASSILNLDELFGAALHLIRERFKYYHAAIFLMDETGRYAILREATGPEGRQLKERGLRLEVGSTSLIGAVIADRTARVVADVRTDPLYLKNELLPATRSEIVLPLVVGERLLGMLDVQAASPNAFGAADVTILQALTDQIAVATNNATRYGVEQTRAEQMTILSETMLELTNAQLDPAATLKLVAQRAAKLVRGELVSLWLAAEENTLALRLELNVLTGTTSKAVGRRLQKGEEVAGQVLESGQPFRKGASYAANEAGQLIETGQALLATPMAWQGKTVGVIVATKSQQGRFFTGEDERVLQLFATQAASVIENTRLLNETRHRAAQLAVSAEVARVATTLQDLPGLLNTSVEVISERFGFYHAGIFLIDDAREWASLRAANSAGGQRMLARGHRLRVGQQGIVGYVTSTGQPRIALNVGADAVHFQNPDLPETHSEMALPLNARGVIIGALDVQSVATNAFSPEDIAVLQILADQLAVAIENARLFEETRRSLEELRALQSTTRQTVQFGGAGALAFRYDGVDIRPFTGTHPSTSGIQVPINAGNTHLGMLAVKRPDAEWLPEDQAFTQAIAERMALALENARLFETTRATLAQTARLYNASRDIAAAETMDDILRTVLMHAVEDIYTRFVIAFIELDHDKRVTAMESAAVWDKSAGAHYGVGQRYTREQLPSLRLLTPGGPTVFPSLTTPEMDERSRAVFQAQGVQAVAAIPLVVGGELIGLFLAETPEPHNFSDEELRPLQAFADQTAIALQNLRLLERTRAALTETRRVAEREQTLAAISARLQSGTTVQSILQLTAEELRRATGSARAVVRLGRAKYTDGNGHEQEAA